MNDQFTKNENHRKTNLEKVSYNEMKLKELWL